jgi:hypothetical protein
MNKEGTTHTHTHTTMMVTYNNEDNDEDNNNNDDDDDAANNNNNKDSVISTRDDITHPPGFTDKGYQIYNLNSFITKKQMIALNTFASKLITTPIFNEEIDNTNNNEIDTTGITEEFSNDETRRSSEPIKYATTRVLEKLIDSVEQIGGLIDRKNKVQECAVLHSLIGGSKQVEHYDATPDKNDFCSCIFAIQDGTKINMNGEEVDIPKGEAIIFHSNLPHHGCCYEIENRRFFFYIAKTKADIPENAARSLPTFKPIYCTNCGVFLYDEDGTSTKQQKRDKKTNHRKGCKKKNSQEKLQSRKAKMAVASKKNYDSNKKQKK